jgi:hypothetical protein
MTIARLAGLLVLSLGVVLGQPLDTMLVLEMSEGSEHATGLIRPRAFAEDDRAGVIGFLRTAEVLQPLTEDRNKLAAALQRAGSRAGGALVQGGKVRTASSVTAGLSTALLRACSELGQEDPAGRNRAILVVFGSEDPGLHTRIGAIRSSLAAAHARLYAIAVQRSDPNAPPLSPRTGVTYPFPVVTTRLMSELVEEFGGRVFERNWDLKKILAAARQP